MKRRILTLILALLMVLSMVVIPSNDVYADDIDIGKLEEELKALESEVEDAKANADTYKKIIEVLNKEIELIDKKISEIEEQIESYNKQLEETNNRLNQAQKDYDNAVADRAIYQKKFEERLSVLYMYGNNGVLDVLFSADSFSDLMSRVQAVIYIIKYDTSIADDLKDLEEVIEAKKLQIEAEKQNLETITAALKESSEKLEEDSKLKEQKVAKAKENKNYWDAVAAQKEKDEEEIRRIIASVNGEGEYKNDFSHIVWATPGYYNITDYYGYRRDPFGKTSSVWHTGIDIGAPGGAKIIAPANGKVITSSYNATYGNYVILSLGKTVKGDTITMLFGHMRARNCKEGDIVSTGDVIGYVGTTGYSTGNHLHWTVRVNGVTVDPLDNKYVTLIKK